MKPGQWVYFNTPCPEGYPKDKWTYDRFGVVIQELGEDGSWWCQLIKCDAQQITAKSDDVVRVSEHMVELLTDEEVSQRIGRKVMVTVTYG